MLQQVQGESARTTARARPYAGDPNRRRVVVPEGGNGTESVSLVTSMHRARSQLDAFVPTPPVGLSPAWENAQATEEIMTNKERSHQDIGADAETQTDEEIREESVPLRRDQGALLDVDANEDADRGRDRQAEGDRPIAG